MDLHLNQVLIQVVNVRRLSGTIRRRRWSAKHGIG